MIIIIILILEQVLTVTPSSPCPSATTTMNSTLAQIINQTKYNSPPTQPVIGTDTETDWIEYCVAIGSHPEMPLSYRCILLAIEQANCELAGAWAELEVAISQCLPYAESVDISNLLTCTGNNLETAKKMLNAALQRAINTTTWCILNEEHLKDCYLDGLLLAIDKICGAFNLAIDRLQVIQTTLVEAGKKCLFAPTVECSLILVDAVVTVIMAGIPMSYAKLIEGIVAACRHLIVVCLTLGKSNTI